MSTFKTGTILGLLPGDIVDGRFQIGGLIGYGGQGVVLSVNHLEWERELALKLPLPESLNSPKKMERFVKEADAWIKLGAHPNVVRCWFVRKVSGLPGLFLDLIPAGSLEDWIKDARIGPGRWPEILRVMGEVAEALAHAHAMGMVHRDIKPENLLLRDNGQVCVTDFGLVKSSDRESMVKQNVDIFAQFGKDTGTTGVGEFLGTPRYGAPEQWNKALTITPATDVYAWGVILYELLCGRRPFDPPGEEPEPLELIHRHLRLPPPHPGEFQPGIPDELAELSLACLSKNPLERPETGLRLVERVADLKLKLEGLPYHRPAPVPKKDLPDLVNNAAVSMHSLGKLDRCRENLEKGLLLQADHPECLYNLIQLDRREGRMGSVESLQRLRRAHATFPLAILCIEEGHAKLAHELLRSIPEQKKSGLALRTEGDALMYLGRFQEAGECYARARRKLPNDRTTFVRHRLAETSSRMHEGATYFPSSTSVHTGKLEQPAAETLFDHSNGELLCVTPAEVVRRHPLGGRVTAREARPQGAGPVRQTWQAGPDLLLADAQGFELWQCVQFKPLVRSPGTVLAVTSSISHILFHHQGQLVLLDKMQRNTNRVVIPEGDPALVKACFNTDQTALYLLLPDGGMALVDSQCRALPVPLPSRISEPRKVSTIAVHPGGLAAVALSDGTVRMFDLAKRLELFTQKLPFAPKGLTFSREGDVLLAYSDQLFGVLNRHGALIHRGKGACGVDPSGTHLLGWVNGFLTLFSLSSFHRIRSWSEKVPPPARIRWSAEGRHALTTTVDGTYRIWEVDEKNRVFERELLLTRGATYEQLLASYDVFQTSMNRAVNSARKGRPFEAYQAVMEARSAKGFLQAEEALRLMWQLCGQLQRTGMEALWERMFYRGIGADTISRDGSLLVTVRGARCSIFQFSGSSTTPLHSIDLISRPIGCHFHTHPSGEVLLVVVENRGLVSCVRVKDGSIASQAKLDLGFVVKGMFCGSSLVALSREGTYRGLDLNTGNLTPANTSPTPVSTIFALPGAKVVVISGSKSRVADLRTNHSEETTPFGLPALPAEISYISVCEEAGVGLLGLADGTILACDPERGKVLFSTRQDVGAITGLRLCLPLALGVSVSSKGRLSLFDLNDGRLFQSFTAHSEQIAGVELTGDGRYLTTRTPHGEFRLWETAWKLCDQRGAVQVSWLPGGGLRSRLGRVFGV